VGQERLGPSHFFIPLVLGPLNSLVWYVPSLRYTRGLGWCMHRGAEVTESSTNKQHHLPTDCVQCYLVVFQDTIFNIRPSDMRTASRIRTRWRTLTVVLSYAVLHALDIPWGTTKSPLSTRKDFGVGWIRVITTLSQTTSSVGPATCVFCLTSPGSSSN
jgi:hypothetical protein